jgi:hypothetical protein
MRLRTLFFFQSSLEEPELPDNSYFRAIVIIGAIRFQIRVLSLCLKKKLLCLRIRITDIIFRTTNPSQTDVLIIIGNF